MSNTSALQNLRIERRPEPRRSGGFFVWFFVLLLLGGAAAGGWYAMQRQSALVVHVATARDATPASGASSADRTILNASGYVTARREATVSSKVTGKVTVVLIEEGNKVKEGQIVARLDDTNVSASLNLAEAQMKAVQASMQETNVRLVEAEKELQRQKWLATKKVAAESETDKSEATVLALRARLRQQASEVAVSERTVESWKQQLEDTIIRAPFAGIVTSKNAQPGEMISPVSAGGGFTRTGICTIVDMDSLEIEIDVNESYINRVSAGQPVEAVLDAYPEWKIPCKVIAIIPTADRQKSTVKVRVAFEKIDPRILPEMSVKVGFRENTKPASAPAATVRQVGVPKSAIAQDENRDVVFVIRGGKAERRAVTVGSATDTETLITAGLTAGERVAADRPAGLVDGVRVKELAQ